MPGAGPIIVFSPLNSLIRDQLERINAFGLRAHVLGGINAFDKGHQAVTVKALKANEVDVLFLTPDMVVYAEQNSTHILNQVVQLTRAYKPHQEDSWRFVPLLVIDEIHVIEEANPKYLGGWKTVWDVLKQRPWFTGARKLGLTATLSNIQRQLVHTFVPGSDQWADERGPRFRKAINLHTVPGLHTQAARVDFVCKYVRTYPDKPLLVFVNFKKDCALYANAINKLTAAQRNGGVAAGYNADMDKDQRKTVEDQFRRGDIRFLVATKALGLGFDKADVRTVIHIYTPPSVTQWYQEFGRAARDEQPAEAILLPSKPWGVDDTIDTLLPLWKWIRMVTQKHKLASVPRTEAEAFLASKQKSDEEIERAIERGLAVGVLTASSKDAKGISVSLTQDTKERLVAMVKQMSEGNAQLKFMMSLREAQKACVWRQLLHQLDDFTVAVDYRCGQCSAVECLDAYQAVRMDTFAGSNLVFKSRTPAGTDVLCLGEPNTYVDMDPNRLQAIASKELPHAAAVPALWVVSCITDRKAEVAKRAREVAEALDFLYVDLVSIKAGDHGSMKDAKTDAERAVVLSKYELDASQVPDFGHLLLFDDVLNTGTTMDHIVDRIKQVNPNITVIGLTETTYKTLPYGQVQLD